MDLTELFFLVVLQVECAELHCLTKKTPKNQLKMKCIEDKNINDIPFNLKESNSGHLCPAHFTQLSRLLKKRPIEEVDDVAEPAEIKEPSLEPAPVEETIAESQEEEPATTLAVSRAQATRRGRPLKHDSQTRFKLAVGSALGVSLNKVGELYQLYSGHDFSDASLSDSPSRTLAVQSLMELHACFRHHLAEHLATSENISLMMDSTTDRHRELLSLYFGGTRKGEKGEAEEWNLPAGVVELSGHTAVTQVGVVEKTLRELNVLQRERNWPLTRVYHVASLTADNTSSNTGANGVRGVLEAKRQEQWRADCKPGACPPLVFKGCEDHISHLASKEIEKRLMIRYKSWGLEGMVSGQHHCSSTALMHVMARLRSVTFHRPFRAFVRLNGGVPPHIPRHSETRYASIDTLAKVMVEYRGFIILFLYRCRSLLTQHDLDALKVLLNAENLEIIRLRALFASRLLLPVMKMANHTRGMLAFKQEMETVSSHVRAIAADPNLLSTLAIAPKDQAVQEQLTATMASIVKLSKGTSTIQEGTGRERDVIDMVGATQAQIELEDGEIGEEPEEEVVLLQGRVAPSTLDLKAPSDKRVPTPEMTERLTTIASDMAKSFLFHQEKHNKAQDLSLSFFMATSRKVERSFAVVKCFLEKNSETRIFVLDALLCLHDFSVTELHSIWERFWEPSFSTRASKKLAANPTTREGDKIKLVGLLAKADEATKSQAKKKQKLTGGQQLLQ